MLSRVLGQVSSGLILGLTAVIYAVSYAALMFSGPLRGFVAYALTTPLITAPLRTCARNSLRIVAVLAQSPLPPGRRDSCVHGRERSRDQPRAPRDAAHFGGHESRRVVLQALQPPAMAAAVVAAFLLSAAGR